MRVINTELIRNPFNWVIVWLMIAFGLIAIGVIKPVTLTPANPEI